MTFPLVSFHSDQVFDPPAASSARKSLKQFYFFSHFFTFFSFHRESFPIPAEKRPIL